MHNSTHRLILTTIVWLGIAALASAAEEEAHPVCAAVRAVSPPRIDGALDDALWDLAGGHRQFTIFRSQGERVDHTEFRIAYDDTWLYLGVDCRNPQQNALEAKIRGHDRGACNDDSFEIFIAPGTEGDTYFHYMLSFANARDEKRVSGSRRDVTWNVPWRAATQTREDGWSGEVALPMCVLFQPGDPPDLRINVARNRRVVTVDAQHVVVDQRTEPSIWSPVRRTFHEVGSFVPVEGITDLQVRVPLLARIASTRVLPYYAREDRTFFGVEFEVEGFTETGGDLQAVVIDRPATGESQEITVPVRVEGIGIRTLSVPVPAGTPCPRDVLVQLRDPVRREVIDEVPAEGLAVLETMSAILDRNYYTSEAEASAVCRIGMPSEAVEGLRVEVRNADGDVLAARDAISPRCSVPFPLAGFPLGVSTVTVALRAQEDDRPDLAVVTLPLRKRAPKPGREWKVDQTRRLLLDNDKPFVPFGMVMSGVRPEDTTAFRELARNNFNTFVVWNPSSPEKLAAYHEEASRHGLYVLTSPDRCARNIEWNCHTRYSGELLERVKRATARPSFIRLKGILSLPIPIPERNAIYGEFYDKNIDRCIEGVERTRDFENLIGYFIFDEPMSSKHFDQYKFGQDYYARIHRADGYHPVFVNYSSHIPEGDEYVNWCDVLMTDPYWTPPAAEGTRRTPNHVAKVCWQTNRRAQAHRQPTWQILVGPLWSGCRKRPLSHRELRCQTYMAFIHKATGIFYFSYAWVRTPTWATFRGLGHELHTIRPFVVGPELETETIYRRAVVEHADGTPEFTETPFDPPNEQYPDVHAAVFSDGNDRFLLLAANSRHYPVECRFEVDGLRAASRAFGDKQPQVDGHAITEILEPYGTRAYLVDLETASTQLQLQVWQQVNQRDLPYTEVVLPFTSRPDRRNLLPNPGFEDENTPTWPDYCFVSKGVATHGQDALSGEKCLRFVHTGRPSYEHLQIHCSPQHDEARVHTFSIYLKGDQEGLKAWIRGTQLNPEKQYGEHTDVTLTTGWKRYTITGMIPAHVTDGSSIFEVRLMEPGTMWADNAQLELGSEATPYLE